MRICWGFWQKKNVAASWGWNPHLKIEMWGTQFSADQTWATRPD
jgi:hypothetical protein